MSLLHLFSFLSAFVLDELGFLSILLTADFWESTGTTGSALLDNKAPSMGGFKASFL